MSRIHFAEPGGHQLELSADEAAQRWSEGGISQQALYWQDGMAEWRPVTEWFPSSATSERGDPPPRQLAREAKSLVRLLKVMLQISAGVAVLSGLFALVSLVTGHAAAAAIESDTISSMDLTQLLVGLASLGVFTTTAIPFLMWIHRANRNAAALSRTPLSNSPGWAVGWYFIPFANLWKPLGAMKEIWQASHRPDQWSDSDPTGPLGLWWGLWILSTFLTQLSFRIAMRSETAAGQNFSTGLDIVAAVVDVVLCFVALRMISTIHREQCGWAQVPE